MEARPCARQIPSHCGLGWVASVHGLQPGGFISLPIVWRARWQLEPCVSQLPCHDLRVLWCRRTGTSLCDAVHLVAEPWVFTPLDDENCRRYWQRTSPSLPWLAGAVGTPFMIHGLPDSECRLHFSLSVFLIIIFVASQGSVVCCISLNP
ncbi:unnamed protein product [Polarella glacialis]|uniref:Uncharacterized protein n=1 Tax=Polarella glacialis TaxID=89957 RepID=A0A813KM02_POLGL|nr:unnamed protein product [Polarella glacialis]CAE8707594.1 unnamed protein product [Polarella glacialis]